MKHQNAMKELRAMLPSASPLQLAIALEAVAYVHAETYMDHNPPPPMPDAERAELRAALIHHSITGALNTAAEVILDSSKQSKADAQPSPEDEARAKAAADAAIAKAADKLH